MSEEKEKLEREYFPENYKEPLKIDTIDETMDKLREKNKAFRERVHIDNNTEPEIYRDD
jgi:hypothetical protein